MSSFALVSVEKGYKVDISERKETVGRGLFLKITDKRVSRNHATLEVSGTSMTILPTHTNPTFYQACGETKFEPLEKDKLKELENGDSISFLPNDLVFRVEKQDSGTITGDSPAKVSQSVKGENSDVRCDEVDDGEVDKNKVDSDEVDDGELDDNEVDDSRDDDEENDDEIDGDKREVEKPARTLEKKRILPSWMTKDKGNAETNQNPKKAIKKKIKKLDATEKKIDKDFVESPVKVKGAPKEKETFTGRNDDDDDDEDDKQNNDNEVKEQASDETEEQKSHKSLVIEVEDKKRKRDDESDVEESRKREKKLPRCSYGVDCYRKNPVHFQEYCHDKTSDDESEDESGDEKSKDDEMGDDLPECPYGEHCYRKNPRHRRQYKHTPQPKTRERRAKRKAAGKILDDDDDGPNDYDFEDSFLDDESESSAEPSDNEDSDWQPPDVDEDDDVSELLAEARDFTQNKKMLKPT